LIQKKQYLDIPVFEDHKTMKVKTIFRQVLKEGVQAEKNKKFLAAADHQIEWMTGKRLVGHSFSISGPMKIVTRKTYAEVIKKSGGKYMQEIEPGLNFLITNCPDKKSKKNHAAKNVKAKFISEKDFLEMISMNNWENYRAISNRERKHHHIKESVTTTPHIKILIPDYNGFVVWEVDGTMIRNDMEEEFTNFAQNLRFPGMIPSNEFWIDKEESRDEAHFFCIHMYKEWQLMKDGKSYEEAVEAGENEEKKARDVEENGIKKYKGKINLDDIHQKLYGECENDVKVWIIDGELVRDKYYVDFTAGGHDLVYGKRIGQFMPNNEIWLDDDNHPNEQKLILLHELHERNLMTKGMNYNNAHKSSSLLEYKCRKNPILLDMYLKDEGLVKIF